MVFGASMDKGLVLDGFNLKVVDLNKGHSIDDLLVHNTKDKNLAILLCEMTYAADLPTPLGVFYEEKKPTYEEMMMTQIESQMNKNKNINLKDLIYTANTWKVE